jgi:ribose transport system permease protein
MTTSRTAGARAVAGRLLGGGSATVFALLGLVFVVILFLNPGFFEPPSLMAFVKKAAPLVVLAVGQYFVIVCGEMDLSVGSLVGAQVVIAAAVIDGQESRTLPVLLLMVAFGVLVGLVNGLVVTVLKVHSLIATLGMMLVLYGAIRLWTGGAPTGALSDGFRQVGREGIDLPVVRQLPWALLVAAAVVFIAVMVMRRPFGRTLITTGDNEMAAAFAGVRVWQVRTVAFVLSSVLATLAGLLIGGYAGVTAQVGEGLEFTAITAVVLGGVVLGGGRGTVLAAMAGALTVEALFTLFNQLSLPSTIRPMAQGLIIIAAVAYAARERATPNPKL